jgi:hypothetical protein
MTETISLCPDILFTRKQPLAGFVSDEGTPAYYCAKCLCSRIEEAIQEGMNAREIADTVSFHNCGHIEDGTGTCGRCAIAIMAMLTYLSMTLHLKPGKDAKRLRALDAVIAHLIGLHGRITPDNRNRAATGRRYETVSSLQQRTK